ncbi:MAG: hypothetical protein N2323_02220 [candidate division WOR-3 bacterium]|nr:hypothetical protein [candidate division WOR-3 bacterium]MCX7836763.1 hypothetical protein [candidate division WOR-3 bacterium]MDW8113599.1 hypothetical protein [candidate division WOR-3 bacterium]
MSKKLIFLILFLLSILIGGNLERRKCWYWNGNNWQLADTSICQLFLEITHLNDSCNKIQWKIPYFNIVICEPQVRTRTPGYWKNHPEKWPPPYHPHNIFYLSGKTWLAVLWQEPRGDAYYILAHQFIAAVLNKASGCPVPFDVEKILIDANLWFQIIRPPVRPNSQEGKKAIRWAERLDIYNNTGR